MNTKCCAECGGAFDDTPLNWPKFRRRYTTCLSCVVAERRRIADARAEKRAQRLARMEADAIDQMSNAATRGGSNVPHSAELLEQVMFLFGGVNGFSQLLLKNYFDSPPGGAQRTKMLDLIAKLVTTNADQGGSKKPLALWSEGELEGELDLRIRQAMGMPTLTLEVVSETTANDPGSV